MGDADEAKRQRGLWLRLGLSLVLAGGFVAALTPYLHAVPADLAIPGWLIPAYLLTLLPYHLLRAGRWQFLVAPLLRELRRTADPVTNVVRESPRHGRNETCRHWR